MNVFDMETMILCKKNENKINRRFVLLEVASDKKFGQHFRPLSKMATLLFAYEKQIQIVLF